MIQYRRRPRTERIILHASHTQPGRRSIEQFLAVTGRTMGLLTIGYHYVIDQGALLCTRPDDCVGSHTPGFNETSIGVCVAGGVGRDGDPEDTFSLADVETLRFLVGDLRARYGAALPIEGHTELGKHRRRALQCPPVNMDALRRRLEA